MTELTTVQQKKLCLPPGGRWFFRQADAFEINIDNLLFGVAWDKDDGKKVYGVYESPEKFRECMLLLPEDMRHGYEIIRANTPCLGFVDVEYLDKVDKDTKLEMVKHGLRVKIKNNTGIDAKLVVFDGTRKVSPDFMKHSYHIHVTNLVFKNNHDGVMKWLLTDLGTSPEWYYKDQDGKEHYIIDKCVNTCNRVWRTEGSCKKGDTTKTPLRVIDGSGYSFSEMIVSRPNGTETFVDPALMPTQEKKRPLETVSDIVPKEDSKRAKCDVSVLPIPRTVINEALRTCGDLVSVVTNVTYLVGERGWQIQCDQKKQSRVCLKNPTLTHKSNNCILFLKLEEAGVFNLNYHCTSEGCKRENRKLGAFAFDVTVSMWLFNKVEEVKPSAEETIHQTYISVKEKFEKSNLLICKPFAFLVLFANEDGSTETMQLKHTEMGPYYIDMTYDEQDGKGNWIQKSFIKKWLRDPSKRRVSSVVVDPKGDMKGVYNLWGGFRAARLDLSKCFTDRKDELAFVIGPIFRHLNEVIANGDEYHANWILDWMANIVQRPWKKTQVPICLYGKQGCGKGIIFDWFRTFVLGPTHTYQTANPEQDLFSRFADGLVNRVFIQVDEVKSLHDHAEKLKNAVTNDTLQWESKNGKKVTVKNFCNLLMTTNNENALHITSDERRFVVFRCKSVHKGDKKYFEGLARHLRLPGVDAWFFKFLMERDLSMYEYDFQGSRPTTDYYLESQKTSIPIVKRFLSGLVNSNDLKSCFSAIKELHSTSATNLYGHFKMWADFEGHRHIPANNSFGRELHRINGIISRKSCGNMWYDLQLLDIKNHLEQTNEYDESAFLDETMNASFNRVCVMRPTPQLSGKVDLTQHDPYADETKQLIRNEEIIEYGYWLAFWKQR